MRHSSTPALTAEEFDEELEISRFRPNIVIAGGVAGAEEEDRWAQVVFRPSSAALSDPGSPPALPLAVTGPCSRCKMVNINQSTGVVDARYLQTLSEYRKSACRVNFGQFLAFVDGGVTADSTGEKMNNDFDGMLFLAEGMMCSFLAK
jgi:uncharacterized protein YcbX